MSRVKRDCLTVALLCAHLCGAATAQEPDAVVRLTPEQMRRVQMEFALARLTNERSVVSEPGVIQPNPESTTVVRAPVDGRVV